MTLSQVGEAPRPWFAYQGMNIVHPAYQTNAYWFDKVDYSKVSVLLSYDALSYHAL